MSRGMVLILALYAGGVVADDGEQGRMLYYGVEIERTIQGVDYTDANCETCHDDAFYQRADRKVHSYASLEAFVEGCNTNLDVGWFPDEVSAVASWMNATYYRFEE
ncbi:hypothetical protein [Marinobacterium halophilum]|nr:hypothetical protein [Marinobacterium halophilum]